MDALGIDLRTAPVCSVQLLMTLAGAELTTRSVHVVIVMELGEPPSVPLTVTLEPCKVKVEGRISWP